MLAADILLPLVFALGRSCGGGLDEKGRIDEEKNPWLSSSSCRADASMKTVGSSKFDRTQSPSSPESSTLAQLWLDARAISGESLVGKLCARPESFVASVLLRGEGSTGTRGRQCGIGDRDPGAEIAGLPTLS